MVLVGHRLTHIIQELCENTQCDCRSDAIKLQELSSVAQMVPPYCSLPAHSGGHFVPVGLNAGASGCSQPKICFPDSPSSVPQSHLAETTGSAGCSSIATPGLTGSTWRLPGAEDVPQCLHQQPELSTCWVQGAVVGWMADDGCQQSQSQRRYGK